MKSTKKRWVKLPFGIKERFRLAQQVRKLTGTIDSKIKFTKDGNWYYFVD